MPRGAATAADVPGKWDVVINGYGYVFLDSVQPSLPFRTHRAVYDITQTFVERQNVGNNYGDQAQDFFLTESQNDWSEGEQQRFLRSTDKDSVRKYWSGMNVDIRVPGQVRIMPQVTNITFPAVVAASAGYITGIIYAAGPTDLYKVTGTTVSTIGAHGLGATPSTYAMVCDGSVSGSVYISTTSAGTVGVRRFNTGAGTFSTFSASGSDVLALNNNTLYGIRFSNSDLVEYSTGGVLSVLFPWRTANGANALGAAWMQPYGGQLAILTNGAPQANRPSLWIYDGNGVSKIHDGAVGAIPHDLCVSQGVIFFSVQAVTRGTNSVNQIYYYSNGNVGLLWEGTVPGGLGTSLMAYANGILFADPAQFRFCYYDLGVGSVQTIGYYGQSGGNGFGDPQVFTGSDITWLQTRGFGTAATAFQVGTIASSATVDSSLFDFDSSLTKLFRGVKVDWQPDSTGDGGSIDIGYRLDSLSDFAGTYTTLQTGAASGTEYPFSGLSGHSISIRITLNKGTSTNGPTLKRIYVRAAPVLEQFRSGLYILDCTGSNAAPRQLRDGTPAPLSGYEMVQNLRAAAQATTPFSVTDKVNGTFTALVDLSDQEGWDVYEVHPAPEDVTRPGSYVVRVKLREV